MTDDNSTPTWSTLDRLGTKLRARSDSLLASLTDEQLLRSLEAARRGEPDPPDVQAAIQRAIKRASPSPAWLTEMSDKELLADLERERESLSLNRGGDHGKTEE